MKKIVLLVALVAVLPAKAEVLTFNFTGAVKTVEENGRSVASSALNGSSISVGYTIKGSFSYDTTTSVSVTYPWQISYGANDSRNSLGFAIDQSGFSFPQPPSVYTTKPAIHYESFFGSAIRMRTLVERFDLTNYAWTDSFSLHLGSPADSSLQLNPSMLASTPPTAFLDRAFRYTYTNYGSGPASSLFVNGSITSLVQVPTLPVPEPATYAMLLAGLASVGLAVRRRQNRR